MGDCHWIILQYNLAAMRVDLVLFDTDGGHFGFFDFIKIAQGWQLHTHLDIIMGMPDMNNQKRKKLYQT